MCDENYQLPGSVPMFTRAAGSTLTPNTSGAVNLSFESVRHCAACGYWHTGSCGMPFVAAGFAAYPQSAPTVWAESSFDKVAARAALHKLADELARLTMNTPGDEQAGVWAAYYDLQAKLK